MLGRLLIYASLVNRINGFPFEPAHEKFQVNVVASHLKQTLGCAVPTLPASPPGTKRTFPNDSLTPHQYLEAS